MSENIKEKEKFAVGICFYKLFWLFLIGCFIGTIYEQALLFVQKGIIESRSGMLYFPLNQVYGVGLASVVYLLGRKERKWHQIIIYGSLIGGIAEYLISFLQESFFNSVSWDYSKKFLNINGRTTVIFALFWGILSLLAIKIVYPPCSRLIEKIPPKFGKYLTNALLVVLAFDLALTGVVLMRQGQRLRGVPASNPVDHFLDKYYNDEYLKKVFPNMELLPEKGDK